MSKIGNMVALRMQIKRLGIEDYDVVDGVVNVHGIVNLNNYRGNLPFQFGKVDGSFLMRTAHMDTLNGIPYYVGEDFDCAYTQLRSMAGISKKLMYVGGNLDCGSFLSTSAGTTHTQRCVSHTLELLLIRGVTHVDIDHSGPIDKIMNKYISNGTRDILSCQDELLDAGFVEQARI